MTQTITRGRAALFAAALLALASCGRTASPAPPAADAHHDAHWSYSGAGAPEHWASLEPAFAACAAGKNQSPIDLAHAAPSDVPNISFHYQLSKINIVNNGHTIQVDYDPGSYIDIDGVHYDLVQFHFHAPSEHLIAGRRYEAELHLVHKSAGGDLAVVGVMLERGAENAALAPVWNALPAQEGPVQHLDAQVNALEMLPTIRTTYRYDGSLTTPPCTEGVKWNVMTAPAQISAAQLAAFTRIIVGNDRPIQPLGARTLIEDDSPAR
jgi:carbonic anhydrase